MGMFTMRKKALPTQLKNGLTFGGFNYLISAFGGGVKEGEGKEGVGGKGGKVPGKNAKKAPVFGQRDLVTRMQGDEKKGRK